MEPSKKISQEYFNQIVGENVNEFGMNEEEAINDAINQLKSQNCELINICKCSLAEQNELVEAIKTLSELKIADLIEQKDAKEKVTDNLKILKKKFEKDLSFRCLANEKNAYQVLISYIDEKAAIDDSALLENYLITLQAFLYQQSDAIQKDGLNSLVFHNYLFKLSYNDIYICSLKIKLTQEKNIWKSPALRILLKCLSTSCELNEPNRQHLVENGLCESLMEIFCHHKTDNSVLIEACQLIRSLLLDDDIRVEFSNAHETAKYIASKLNGLDVLLSIGLGYYLSVVEFHIRFHLLILSVI